MAKSTIALASWFGSRGRFGCLAMLGRIGRPAGRCITRSNIPPRTADFELGHYPPAPPVAIPAVVPPAPPPVVSVAPPRPEPPKPLVSELAELPERSKERWAPFFKWRAVKKDIREGTMVNERRTLRRFREVCGDRPVDGYGRGDVTRFLDTLRRLPATYGRSRRRDHDRPFAEIIAGADAKGAERLKDKTVKKHLSVLSQFFKFARDEGHLSQAAVK